MTRDMVTNIGMNMSHPKKVKNKIKNPVSDENRLSALWVGHATVLVQMDDKVVLFDPFFTLNSGEIQRRIWEPGVDLDAVKKCDLILLSHSHFDHTNFGTLDLLNEKFPGTPLVFPDGLEQFLPVYDFPLVNMKRGVKKPGKFIGESKTINGVKVTTVVAYHWGGRYGLDGLIWGYDSYTGYIIEYNGLTVYFSGDTAYDDNFFKFLGEKYNIDIALVPIGPCSDCDHIHKPDRHVYPKGALKILDDTKSKVMIPIHYGTLYEKSKDPEEPRYVLEELVRKNSSFVEKVKILHIGGQYVVKKDKN
jgi:L-ascorbate metabolism protein UlaG (beta-lactamase superfamily)